MIEAFLKENIQHTTQFLLADLVGYLKNSTHAYTVLYNRIGTIYIHRWPGWHNWLARGPFMKSIIQPKAASSSLASGVTVQPISMGFLFVYMNKILMTLTPGCIAILKCLEACGRTWWGRRRELIHETRRDTT